MKVRSLRTVKSPDLNKAIAWGYFDSASVRDPQVHLEQGAFSF